MMVQWYGAGASSTLGGGGVAGGYGTPTQLIGALPQRSYNIQDLLINVNEGERSLIFGLNNLNGLLIMVGGR
jgi:hypothetical protein